MPQLAAEAWPRHTAKELARAEGCSVATAKRMINGGRAARFRIGPLLARLDAALSARIQKIEELRQKAREALDDDSAAAALELDARRRRARAQDAARAGPVAPAGREGGVVRV